MTLSLTVLGGAAAWPNPGQGCSAYLITSANANILLDCGPNTLLELRQQVDYHNLDAIVLSHCHADHMLDLVPFRYGLKYGPNPSTRRIPLWLPPGGIERLELLAEALAFGSEDVSGFWSGVFDPREYDPSGTLRLDEVTITFTPTQHFVPCYAMRIVSVDGKAFGYSADAGTIEPLVALMAGTTHMLVEATERDHDDRATEQRGHLTPEDAGRLAASCGATTLILTHLWSERPDQEVMDAAADAFNGEILIAKRGLRVDV